MKFVRSLSITPVVLLAFALTAWGQATEPDYVLSYRAGNNKAALEQAKLATKRDSRDGKAWYYLGLVRANEGDYHDARRSLKNAQKYLASDTNVLAALAWSSLRVGALSDAGKYARESLNHDANNAQAHYVTSLLLMRDQDFDAVHRTATAAISVEPTLWAAYRARAFASIGKFDQARRANTSGDRPSDLLRDAANDLETYVKNVSPPADDPFNDSYLESVRFFAEYYSKTEGRDDSPAPGPAGRTSVRITSKPGAPFSEEAREARIEGTIRVTAQLKEDGRVGHILLLTPLGFGLDESVMAAASKIRFEPAKLNGVPTYSLVTVEYSFRFL